MICQPFKTWNLFSIISIIIFSDKRTIKFYLSFNNFWWWLALGALQRKKLATFYIEWLIEVTHQPDIGIDSLGGLGNLEKISIINDLIQNITICKEVYNNLFNVVADYKADEYVVFLGKRLLHPWEWFSRKTKERLWHKT